MVKPLKDILEAEWQTDVVKLAKEHGWLVFHAYDSRRTAGTAVMVLLVMTTCTVEALSTW